MWKIFLLLVSISAFSSSARVLTDLLDLTLADEDDVTLASDSSQDRNSIVVPSDEENISSNSFADEDIQEAEIFTSTSIKKKQDLAKGVYVTSLVIEESGEHIKREENRLIV